MYHFKLTDMNELAKVNQTMSSRMIAELTGKQHKHVLRDIRYLEESYVEVFGAESKFGLSDYRSADGRKLQEFLLTKSQTLFVVSGYDAVLRAKIQKRWEQLESERRTAQVAIPSRLEFALMLIEAEKELQEANETIQDQAPAVRFVEELVLTNGMLTMEEAAKALGTGRTRLFQLLRNEGVIMTYGTKPRQEFVERGYFTVKVKRYRHHVNTQTFVTPAGLEWLKKKYF